MESLDSLGYHCGSWEGEAIQLLWGLQAGEGRLRGPSLPFSLAGEREEPSPEARDHGESAHTNTLRPGTRAQPVTRMVAQLTRTGIRTDSQSQKR